MFSISLPMFISFLSLDYQPILCNFSTVYELEYFLALLICLLAKIKDSIRSRLNKFGIWTVSHVITHKSLFHRTLLFFRLKFLEDKNTVFIRAINEIQPTGIQKEFTFKRGFLSRNIMEKQISNPHLTELCYGRLQIFRLSLP